MLKKSDSKKVDEIIENLRKQSAHEIIEISHTMAGDIIEYLKLLKIIA